MKVSFMVMHMNRFVYLFKNNIVAVLVFVLLASISFFAWFFFHPASSYHERQTFVICFKKIGSLAPGSFVRVNGIDKGSVVKTELTDEGVYVTIRIFADYHIPKNSSFRLINTGLVGKQEVAILAGDAPSFLLNGDTVKGLTDQGFSDISRNLVLVFNDLDTIKGTIHTFVDSIKNGSIGQSLSSIQKKGRFLTQDTKKKVSSWISDFNKAKTAALALVPEDPKVKKDIDLLISDLDQLLKKLDQLQQELTLVSFNIPENGSVALFLAESNPLFEKIDSMGGSIDLLIEDVKKNGLALNIDIF